MATAAGIQVEARTQAVHHPFHPGELRQPWIDEEIGFAGRQAADGLTGARRTAANTGIALGLQCKAEGKHYDDSRLQLKKRSLTVAAPNEAHDGTPSRDRQGA